MVIKLRAPRRNLHSTEAYNRALGVSWTSGNGARKAHTVINTLDDALELVQRQEKAKATRKRHREEAGTPARAVTQKRLFNIAKAIAASPATRNKVKMPVFSIQQREEIDA